MAEDISNTTLLVVNEIELLDALEQLNEHIGYKKMIGFDCEWVDRENWLKFYARDHHGVVPLGYTEEMERIRLTNSNACHVSLIQIAAYDGFTILVRLVFFESFPNSLRQLLEDGSIVKLGVNIREDCNRLYNDWNVLVNGWVDLRNVYTEIPNLLRDTDCLSVSNKTGLKAFGTRYVPEYTDFTQGDRFQNWNRPMFTPNQIRYAAQDARIAVKTVAVLAERYLDLNMDRKNVETVRFWRRLYNHLSAYFNRPFDMERYQKKEAKRNNQLSKKGLKKEHEDDSSSDVDIDWNADPVTSAAGATIFCDNDGEPAVAVSCELIKQCKRSCSSLSPMICKFDANGKCYIVKCTLSKASAIVNDD